MYRYARNAPEQLLIGACDVLEEVEALEEGGEDYKMRVRAERGERIVNKKMHGKFFRDISKSQVTVLGSGYLKVN